MSLNSSMLFDMKKCIWIVNYYTSSPSKTHNPRYLEFAKEFMEQGYDVVIFNSSVTERMTMSTPYVEKRYGKYHFVHIKSPSYKGNGLKRMFSIWMFAFSLFRHCKLFPSPDVILHNTHLPFDYPVYWVVKKLKAKYVAEYWDMWPDDFVSFGFISAKNPFMRVSYQIEYHLLKKADAVVYTLVGALKYLQDKGWTIDKGGKLSPDKIFYNNNGVQLQQFDKDKLNFPRPDEDINERGIIRIVYVGSLSLANSVRMLVDAAAILKSNKRYRFFIYGDGSERESLMNYCKENGVDNVIFKETSVPFCEVAWIVSQATVNIMNYKKGFAPYGVSSGKMFLYFAAGKPICCNIALSYSEITARNIGIDRDFKSAEEYAQAIQTLAEQPKDEYDAMCKRARKAAEDFDYKVLSVKEYNIIEYVLQS